MSTKIFSTPVSKSDKWCLRCNHVFDELVEICDCEPVDRKIVKFSEYLKNVKEKNENK